MSYPLGALVPLTITVKNAAGAATATTPVTLTITQPDGTTVTPTVSTSSTGVYFVDFAASQAGRHLARWVTGGTVISAYADVFEVDPADRMGLVSLADVKRHLNLPTSRTVDDDELLFLTSGVTDAVESHVGRPIRRQTVTDVFSVGAGPLILRKTPCPCVVCSPHRLLQVLYVGEDGIEVTASNYRLDSARSLLYRDSLGSSWSTLSLQNVSVTYVAGYTTTPPWARQAVLRAIEGLWQTSQQSPHPALGQDATGAPDWAVAQSFMLPYAVQSILNPHRSSGF